MLRHRLIAAAVMALALLGAGSSGTAAAAPGGPVDVVQLEGPLDRITGSYLLERIQDAPAHGTQVVLVTVNSSTSYGFDANRLVEAVRASSVPVVVWVGDRGAVAAGGAGRFVASADLVAAVPDARIEPAVRVDLVAPAVGDVVVALDGRELRGVRLETAREVSDATSRPRLEPSVTVRFIKPGFLARVLHAVTSPHLASFLLLAGLSAIAFEFFTAGIGLAGLTGALCLVLAGYGLVALPTRWWGVVLMTAGVVAYGTDVQKARVGKATVAGTVLVTGGMLGAFLGGPGAARLVWWPVALVVTLTLLFWVVAMRVMVRARYSTPQVRREGLVGEEALAATNIDPGGLVRLRGALWEAKAVEGQELAQGEQAIVVGVEGSALVVGTIQPIAEDEEG